MGPKAPKHPKRLWRRKAGGTRGFMRRLRGAPRRGGGSVGSPGGGVGSPGDPRGRCLGKNGAGPGALGPPPDVGNLPCAGAERGGRSRLRGEAPGLPPRRGPSR